MMGEEICELILSWVQLVTKKVGRSYFDLKKKLKKQWQTDGEQKKGFRLG